MKHDLHIQRYLLTGILTVFPLWLTWVVFEFVLRQLSGFSAPLLDALFTRAANSFPLFGFLLDVEWLRFAVAVVVTLIVSRPIGMALQERFTTEGKLGNLHVVGVRQVKPSVVTQFFRLLLTGGRPLKTRAYRILTEG